MGKNQDLNLNGMSIENAVNQADGMLLQEYRINIVLANNEDARSIVFIIAPIILRIQIDTVVLDLKDNISVFINELNLIRKLL